MLLPIIVSAVTVIISILTFWAANTENKKKAKFISIISILLVCVSAYAGCKMQVELDNNNEMLSDSLKSLRNLNLDINSTLKSTCIKLDSSHKAILDIKSAIQQANLKYDSINKLIVPASGHIISIPNGEFNGPVQAGDGNTQINK